MKIPPPFAKLWTIVPRHGGGHEAIPDTDDVVRLDKRLSRDELVRMMILFVRPKDAEVHHLKLMRGNAAGAILGHFDALGAFQ
jgi:hypothetical protein